ncbi:NusG domain II-containing protein [Maledivibacter halophilus]|uniref:Uncharacterized protein n=1 Tax=Maledivibacter halophilus TaxID=36842 RepID=A0A1T5IJA1_9FIRM|nr:NusG domain II-containing protein [Maledivibacter halophilus]SKC39284.1 hypothetical protein SAMN02194393_00455 [Maledivibacter halophilus]
MKRFDIIIIVLVVLISLASLGFLKLNSDKEYEKKYIEISVDGEIIKTIPFDDKSNNDEFTVKTKLGTNTISIKDGKVEIIEADCPDKLCVKDGPISQPGEILVCLPNKVVIEVKGDRKREVDDLSY